MEGEALVLQETQVGRCGEGSRGGEGGREVQEPLEVLVSGEGGTW